MPPRFGKLDSKAWGDKYAREIHGFHTEPMELKKAHILNLNHEIDDDLADFLTPKAMHPSIPAYATVTVVSAPESPMGPFVYGEVKVACRAGVRPRDFVLRSFCNNPEAARELSQRWGYPMTVGDAKMIVRHDRIQGKVTLEGLVILEMEMFDRDFLSGNDIQYIANMHLARNTEDGVLTLVQIDPDYVFHRAERGRPILHVLDNAAWGDSEGHLKLRNPISMSYAIADIELPAIRYVTDPERDAFRGTTKVAKAA